MIFTAYNQYGVNESLELSSDDFVICADGGYLYAQEANIVPDVVIGDFDSLKTQAREFGNIKKYPAEKDETDTMLCLKYGIEHGYSDFVIAGGMGGRLDHTVANLQCLSYAVENNKKIWMVDSNNLVTMIAGGSVEIEKKEGFKLSLLSFTDECRGVSVKGTKYQLNGAVLSSRWPVGISNEFIAPKAEISCSSGKLLICVSRDGIV